MVYEKKIEIRGADFRPRYNIADSHLHFLDFVQDSDGLTALTEAMDASGVSEAILFGMPMMQYPLYYMAGALILCLVTGVLYEKNRNIWGAVLIHFAIGFLPRCFGVLQILEGYHVN